jgi:uncharacterized phage-associated protein
MYYAQAWHIVWEEEPLFADDFQAWANGPVIPALYAAHRGMFQVTRPAAQQRVQRLHDRLQSGAALGAQQGLHLLT